METLIFKSELLSLIKEKPELNSLDDSYVDSIFQSLLDARSIIKLNSYSSFKQCKRSKVCNTLVSSTRKILRERYGVFIRKPLVSFKKNLSLVDSFNSPIVDIILNSHQSTFERFSYYSSFYPLLFEELFSLGLKKSFSLGDFACGYNPLSYKFLPVKPSKYFACDLSEVDMGLINSFFKQTNIVGSAKGFNILSDDFFKFLESNSFDVVFLFKALDSLEAVKKHSSKSFLDKIDSDILVVSFPLVSIGGNVVIDSSKRSWFENFCVKQGWFFKTLSLPNELFYIIVKNDHIQ